MSWWVMSVAGLGCTVCIFGYPCFDPAVCFFFVFFCNSVYPAGNSILPLQYSTRYSTVQYSGSFRVFVFSFFCCSCNKTNNSRAGGVQNWYTHTRFRRGIIFTATNATEGSWYVVIYRMDTLVFDLILSMFYVIPWYVLCCFMFHCQMASSVFWTANFLGILWVGIEVRRGFKPDNDSYDIASYAQSVTRLYYYMWCIENLSKTPKPFCVGICQVQEFACGGAVTDAPR